LKRYLSLAKPGIIFGNLISAAGGFFLGSRGHVDIAQLFATLTGLALVIGGGCTLNNCIDRDIDSIMKRTQARPLVTKAVSVRRALIFGLILALAGLVLLQLVTNVLTAMIATFGFIIYVFAYSLWLKRSPHGTWVGGLSGAVPPLAAYCAASNQFDWAALVIYVMYVLWQFPHAYAIGILHLEDYILVSMPILPVVRGVKRVRQQAPYEIAAFLICASLLFFLGQVGWIYLLTLIAIGFLWIKSALRSSANVDDRLWARQSFAYSILMVVGLSFTMAFDWV
jgi:protoheme IX farnesyltransferase